MASEGAAPPISLDFGGFRIKGVWLDSAHYHPLSAGAVRSIESYLRARSRDGSEPNFNTEEMQTAVRALAARLLNAEPGEICFVPSATAAENFVRMALGLATSGRIVTNQLHFHGSLYHYARLAERGVDVRILATVDGETPLQDLRRALEGGADLVAVSLVSAMNGYVCDLPAVCQIAHEAGALVYADITQAAGAISIDVKASGVDFCACSTYKWLMGDMGLGLLYVRREIFDRLIAPLFGSRQLLPRESDSTGWRTRDDAAGLFEVGTTSNTALAALSHSLTAILETGVEVIAAHRRPLMERLRKEAPNVGLHPITPAHSDGPILAFSHPMARGFAAPLARARTYVTLYDDRIRVAPSVFNTERDVERFLAAIALGPDSVLSL
jgi:selenocysteine lyase/cysteine desulfurase